MAVEAGSGKGGKAEKDKNSGRTFPISPGYAGEGQRGARDAEFGVFLSSSRYLHAWMLI
jgi:hypothetical protein